ncbi:MAG TPA: DUF72 domain-containing protein [Spirochaetaceae bacterium]|nr:DUF72 domain-containing protein [Spirochaetaceae bacterium]HAW84702.1 DUF72 domain-containing protein [Spirochaetaceae bacterium]HBO40925.1 DUF72 domain-containing protein [Spirochaetaceae bacterium]HCQ85813.1 DUF72 domain-containing protein [Spirochaetaceae bacterium]
MAMNSIQIGTSGYSYDDWREVFYPADLKKEAFLEYYALFFPFVELNFSYYAMPEARNLSGMMQRTPASFQFAIKAHRSLTHEVDAGWPEAARHFRQAVAVLAERQRLVCVLLQLPFGFHYTPDNRQYLSRLLAALDGLPLAVEFRNNEWGGARVAEEMERRRVASVMVDQPDLPGLPLPAELVTGDFGYFRFHGRNQTNWWRGDNVSRYDYAYSGAELGLAQAKLRRMAARSTLWVAFNNHAGGKAVHNARELKALLEPLKAEE